MLPSRRFYLDSIFDGFMDGVDNFDVIKCDVYEKEGNYYIEADIPGFKKEEISVECNDGYVTIVAEKNNEYSDNDKQYIKRERFYGKTVRKFYVGNVDNDKISAEFKDGILEIVVPKEEKTDNKRVIEIK